MFAGATLRGPAGPPSRTRAWSCVLPGLVLIAAVGCGPGGPARYAVEGRVTFRGQPVPNGMVRFEPDGTKGNRGPVGYAAIVDGRYTTVAKGARGALKGPLVVWISGGPPPDPEKEFVEPFFSEYRTTGDIQPQAFKTTVIDFDVPESAAPPPGKGRTP